MRSASRITAEEREGMERIQRRLALAGRITAPFAWAFSASLVALFPATLALGAWRWHQGALPLHVFASAGGLAALVGSLFICCPPPGGRHRERVIARWLARAACGLIEGIALAAWEFVLQPIVESAYTVGMIALACAITLGVVVIGMMGVDVASGRPPRSLGPLTNQRDIAMAAAFLFVCGVAVGVMNKVLWAVAGGIDRFIERRGKVTFGPTRDGGRFVERNRR